MADRKAQNKYYPPGWDPSKGSINKFVGQHPLRARARKLDQGILIVRFELPYNIWCNGCNAHIAMGVRFNAEKKKIGMYYTTPIFEFRFKCHVCSKQWITVNTDPKNAQYLVVDGGKKKAEDWTAEENETIDLKDDTEKLKLLTDPLYKLEHGVLDSLSTATAQERLTTIEQYNEQTWSDPYTLSQKLRKKFRENKKSDAASKKECDSLRDRYGLSLDILPKDDKLDINSGIVFKKDERNIVDRKDALLRSSIFIKPKNNHDKQQHLVREKAADLKAIKHGFVPDPFSDDFKPSEKNSETLSIKPTAKRKLVHYSSEDSD